jgi:hypothetical protein
LLCSQSGNYPENNLAKFGYISGTKFFQKKIVLSSRVPTGTYDTNLAIWKKNSKSGEFGPFFS